MIGREFRLGIEGDLIVTFVALQLGMAEHETQTGRGLRFETDWESV
jgi:hypothetical protein